jgi:hypothetical protein
VNLKDVFSSVAHKQLVAVDLPDLASNQHELNGSVALKGFFGTKNQTRGTLNWTYFADDQDPSQESADFTFYDSRAKSSARTGRSEWRFYYYGNFLLRAKVGDWLVFAKAKSSDRLHALVFQQKSAWLRAARVLFGVKSSQGEFDSITTERLQAQGLELLQREILSALGLEIAIPAAASDQDLMLQTFGRVFPATKKMAQFARAQVDVDINRPDETLVRWLDREEQLFRALENVVIRERLDQGFRSVDEFIEYSLSVQNRRKSRMGHALQNHLAELFDRHHVRYTAQARTEGNNRPDFVFPGENAYHDEEFDKSLLVMLGVKSTSKDRWRQVLDEADRISKKHLCTLEAGISVKQTDAMRGRHLTLVVPSGLHQTYTSQQRSELLSIEDFVRLVRRLHA